jgi:hypothetical protein
VVLNLHNVAGASRQPPGDPFQLSGVGAGTEHAVLLFSRTRLNQASEPFNWVMAVWSESGNIQVTVREKKGVESGYLAYILNRDLKVINLIPSQGLIKLYEEARATGRLNSDLVRDELPGLRNVSVLRGPR